MKPEEWKLIVRRIERSRNATELELDELLAIVADLPMETLSRPVPQASGGILFYAARHAHAAVLAALVRRGVDPRALPEAGRYPLYSACCGLERLDNVRILIAAGADPNDVEPGDISPLMRASGTSNSELVRLLLEAGADPFHVSAVGEDAITYARKSVSRYGQDPEKAAEIIAMIEAARTANPPAPPPSLAGAARGQFTRASAFAKSQVDNDLTWAVAFCAAPGVRVSERLCEIFDGGVARHDAGLTSVDRKTEVLAFVLEVPDTDWTMVVLDIAEPRVARASRLAQAKELSTIGRTVAFLTCTADVFEGGKLVAEHRWDFGEHGPPRTKADPDGSKHDAKMLSAMDAFFEAEGIRFPNVELRVVRGGYQQLRAYGPVSKLHLVVKGAKSTKKSAPAKAPSKNTSSKTAAASKSAKAKPTKPDSTKKR